MKRGTVVLIAVLLVVGPAVGVTTYLVLERILLPRVPFPGELALEILQDDPYTELVVEVAWTDPEAAPSETALVVLRERLLAYTLKEEVEYAFTGVVETNLTVFTTRDLFDLERTHKETRTEGGILSLYLLYVDGRLAENRNALGATYTGGSVAIFKEVLERAAQTGGLPVDQVETAILVHEFGHLMGLVELTYESEVCEVHRTEVCILHEGRWTYHDPDHPFHSRNRSDVMYWAIQVAPGVRDAPPPPTDFGFETQYDLEQLRMGGYETFPSQLREEAKAFRDRLLGGTGEAAPAPRERMV